MAFSEQFQIDDTIWDELRIVNLNNDYLIEPILMHELDFEAKQYIFNSKHPIIEQFLPDYYIETEEEAKGHLHSIGMQMYLRGCIFGCIRPIGEPVSLGYVMAKSPIMNPDINAWTVDVWLNPVFQGKHIGQLAANGILDYLMDFGLKEVCARIPNGNAAGIQLATELGMVKMKEIENENISIYGCKIKENN